MLHVLFGDAAKVLDSDPNDHVGTLVLLEYMPGGEPLALLRVRCATTSRYHVLRVPPSCRTARKANAWTWRLEGEEYRPMAEA